MRFNLMLLVCMVHSSNSKIKCCCPHLLTKVSYSWAEFNWNWVFAHHYVKRSILVKYCSTFAIINLLHEDLGQNRKKGGLKDKLLWEWRSSLPPCFGYENGGGVRVKPLLRMHLDHIVGCLNLWYVRASTETSAPRWAKRWWAESLHHHISRCTYINKNTSRGHKPTHASKQYQFIGSKSDSFSVNYLSLYEKCLKNNSPPPILHFA